MPFSKNEWSEETWQVSRVLNVSPTHSGDFCRGCELAVEAVCVPCVMMDMPLIAGILRQAIIVCSDNVYGFVTAFEHVLKKAAQRKHPVIFKALLKYLAIFSVNQCPSSFNNSGRQ